MLVAAFVTFQPAYRVLIEVKTSGMTVVQVMPDAKSYFMSIIFLVALTLSAESL